MTSDETQCDIDSLLEAVGDRLAAARTYLEGVGFGDGVTLDHIGIQTYTSADYEHLKDRYSTRLRFLSERVAGGRRISNFEMRRRLLGLNEDLPPFLELFEPTETELDVGRQPWFWHMAFVDDRITQDLTLLEQAKTNILWQLEVGSKKVVFLPGPQGQEIEIASESLESSGIGEHDSAERRGA